MDSEGFETLQNRQIALKKTNNHSASSLRIVISSSEHSASEIDGISSEEEEPSAKKLHRKI